MTGKKTGRTNQPGAGRPLTGKPRLVSWAFTLPAEQVAWLAALREDGNKSKALRVVIDAAMAGNAALLSVSNWASGLDDVNDEGMYATHFARFLDYIQPLVDEAMAAQSVEKA